jgi:hypothetical protein
VKRAVLYMRVSTLDQPPETQLYDLRGLAAQRGPEIVEEYIDKIIGDKAKRPGLDRLLADARRGKFEVVLVWSFDRIARILASKSTNQASLDGQNRCRERRVHYRTLALCWRSRVVNTSIEADDERTGVTVARDSGITLMHRQDTLVSQTPGPSRFLELGF